MLVVDMAATHASMNIELLLFVLAMPAIAFVIVLAVVLPRRIRMERCARALLAQHPDAERTSIYLAFHSGWPSGKEKEMDAKISEMSTAGWTFLRGAEASPLRTIRSWGGGLTLHFIRVHSSPELQTPHAVG
jgi:hypothetical protein